jgi:hypothetical protein
MDRTTVRGSISGVTADRLVRRDLLLLRLEAGRRRRSARSRQRVTRSTR